jgi:hypothetical protein
VPRSVAAHFAYQTGGVLHGGCFAVETGSVNVTKPSRVRLHCGGETLVPRSVRNGFAAHDPVLHLGYRSQELGRRCATHVLILT